MREIKEQGNYNINNIFCKDNYYSDNEKETKENAYIKKIKRENEKTDVFIQNDADKVEYLCDTLELTLNFWEKNIIPKITNGRIDDYMKAAAITIARCCLLSSGCYDLEGKNLSSEELFFISENLPLNIEKYLNVISSSFHKLKPQRLPESNNNNKLLINNSIVDIAESIIKIWKN